MTIQLKRVYDPAADEDGERILIDRIWPRGLTKEKARLTSWMKEVAPSPELRIWFGHRPERFEAFKARYESELSGAEVQPLLEKIRSSSASGKVTLLYAAKDRQHNHAIVLKAYLEEQEEKP
ncbi:DUF488 domain-containing protein [Paenibacillus sp. SAF-054]|uniref:DUF488 domain-containing protein n=1 Tax=unclassified Paenibacillus TaxID=185978 RepID=UPI003F7EBCB6